MRPPVDTITAPPFPREPEWVNVAPLRMDQQRGRPVLVEFWDFCRVNSMRTLPYVRAWHERYAEAGLRVIGVHTAGFAPSRDPDAVRARSRGWRSRSRCDRQRAEVWDIYGNQGWPGRYLWDQRAARVDYHFGEGAYDETEREIQGLLGVEREPLAPLRPEDAPGALLPAQTEDQPGPYCGPYEAGGVWAVVSGAGALRANGREIAVAGPGCLRAASSTTPHRGRARARRSAAASTCHATASRRGSGPLAALLGRSRRR